MFRLSGRLVSVATALAVFGLTGSAFAADYYWNPAVSSGAWAEAANWCSDAEGTTPATEYPNATDAVIHFTSDAEVALTGAFQTGAFTVQTGASLTLTGTDAAADVDLDGAPRKQERSVGLGCYEGRSSGLILIVR